MSKNKKKTIGFLDMMPYFGDIGKEEASLAKEILFLLDDIALKNGKELKAEHILIWWLLHVEKASD